MKRKKQMVPADTYRHWRGAGFKARDASGRPLPAPVGIALRHQEIVTRTRETAGGIVYEDDGSIFATRKKDK